MTEHSREPWRVAGDRPEGVVIVSADDRIVAVAVPPHRGRIDANTRADAARIVAAVNACGDIPTRFFETTDIHDYRYAASAAIGLLWRLAEASPEDEGGCCRYCHRWTGTDSGHDHELDCPYAAARAFLEGMEARGDG